MKIMRMKRQFLLLAVLCLAVMQAWGQTVIASGECGAEGDNFTWTLTDDGTLTISGEGAMADYFNVYGDAPWHVYQNSIRACTIADGVTSIGDYAFRFCLALTGITCHAATPPAVGKETFDRVERTIPVYVPAGSIEAYRAAECWNEFTDYRPIETTGITAPSLAKSITVKDGEVHILI